MSSSVQIQKENRVAVLTIDRPKALNALNEEVLLELRSVISELENISVVILTGSGEKAFVAGADISQMSGMTPLQARAFSELGHSVIELIERSPYITIAAVNGFALGGGLELAMACDLIYASKNAKLGLPETNLGIIPGFGGTVNLVARIGFHRAMEMILTGKPISADEARTLGLILEVFEPQDLIPKVKEMANKLSKKGILSLLAARRLVRSAAAHSKEKAMLLERESFATLFSSGEPREGMNAFLEKREPHFSLPS